MVGGKRKAGQMRAGEEVGAMVALVRKGWLVPVQVFGRLEESWGYGLCDRFSEHAPGGSDCNRAAFFLLRPSDEAMDDPALRAALEAVLENPNEHLWEQEDERRGHVVNGERCSDHDWPMPCPECAEGQDD